jgi:FkbM family methyltransferase
MNATVSKALRSVQVFFPGIQDLRFKIQRKVREATGATHEDDFELLSVFCEFDHAQFLDIGANRGDAIQSMLLKCPRANVVAFEPNPLLGSKLLDLYKEDTRVDIINSGLGSADDEFPLYVPFYRNYMFDGLASFQEKNARDWLKNRIYGYREEWLQIQQVMCTVQRLDDFNLSPVFIKIDVQGFEYAVLQGGRQTISKHRPVVLIEAPKHAERIFFSTLNYQPYVYRNGRLTAGTDKFNVLYIPKEKIEMFSAWL